MAGFGIMLGGGGGEFALHKMSDETGGHVFKVDRRHTLDEVFKELQDEMRSQYAIGYTPSNDVKDGSYRKLDLKTGEQGTKSAGAQRLLRHSVRVALGRFPARSASF